MRTNRDRNWDLIGDVLAGEASGKSPRMFASRKTLFGIPSALDTELEALAQQSATVATQQGGSSADGVETLHSAAAACDAADGGCTKIAGRATPTRVRHPLEPVFDENSRVLILGTMPSPKSRETGFYYNHPQNRFWRVMAALLDEEVPQTNEEKKALVLRHGIALWDVLAECEIQGASDGTIAACVPNDIGYILAKSPIEAIFCTGVKAFELYGKYCELQTGMPATRLPSTSPANASISLDQLVEAYRAVLAFCK